MKHILVKLCTSLLGLWLVWYSAWLLINNAQVASDSSFNLVVFILVILLWVYIVMLAFFARAVPTSRFVLALLWFLVMIVADLYLVDTPDQYIYLADITKLVSVVLVVWWLSKLRVTPSIQLAKDEKDIEIIEV